MKTVSLFMDVEDPINRLADNAALDLANLFTDTGVRGSFCLTGEKCRTLRARGRTDVIAAYLPHCLGLHTDTHSYHPTTMERFSDLPFGEGCDVAFRTEKKGFEAFEKAFGRKPVFWGGAGNTWSPEITAALGKLRIPAYSYALTRLPGEAVHRFNGVFALPQAIGISEDDWADDLRAASAEASLLSRLDEIDQPWIGIFVGHPTRLRYKEFWDKPYSAGRTPPKPEFVEPVLNETYVRAKVNLSRFLRRFKAQARIIGVDEALDLPWSFRPPTDEELNYFRTHTAATLRGAKGWPIHRPDLDVEPIVEKTLALESTLEVAVLED